LENPGFFSVVHCKISEKALILFDIKTPYITMKTFSYCRLVVFMATITLLYCNNVSAQQVKNTPLAGYGKATYSGLTESDFMKNWLILGPVKIGISGTEVSEAQQKEFFDQDLLKLVTVNVKKPLTRAVVGNKEYTWKQAESEDGLIDFARLLEPSDFSVAYALAEINSEADEKLLVSVGSDDGLKIFLNGALVHNNWIARSTTPDEDIIPLQLKKGSNQILVKVQNMQGGWSFIMRKPGKETLANMLTESAGRGNLDNVIMLVENGAAINATNSNGLTAFQLASVSGREKVCSYLKEKGADTEIPLPSFESLVNDIFKGAQKESSPGVSVLVAKDGNILYEKGFGFADVGNKVPVSPETKFRIGSITKQFIAASILKLQEEGKLTVHDTLSAFFPDFPRGNEVTIHHLLTHTSGIHSYTNRPDFLKYVTLHIEPKALIDTIKTLTYDFNPGDRYQYNNSGFFILGYILEKISGKSLADYLSDSIFKPLGMNNTGIYQTNLLLDNEAYGYSYDNGKLVKALDWDMSWAGGAGALYSTVKDLFLWNEALFNGKVLSEESMKAAFTPVVLNNNEKVDYGYGWSLEEYRGQKFIGHGGGLHGFTSYIERQPENHLTVTVLCNSIPAPEGVSTNANSRLIAEYLLWSQMGTTSSIDPELKIDEQTLLSYTGRYNYGNGAILTVTLENGQLYAQLTSQSKFPIYPVSKNEFAWKVVEARVKFTSNDSGVVTHATHNQNGQHFDASKLVDEIPVQVDASVFDKFVGKYSLGNNYIIEIIKEDNKLFGQAPNLPRFHLLPASETEYFVREMNARIIFKPDSNGIPDRIAVLVDGVEQTAMRMTNP
jgi:CubicO group peptidase (beta-lactamase class C family)